MGRKRKKSGNVYLGKRVPDVGEPGLDSLAEVRGIAKAIYEDYRSGRIPKTLAVRRLSLLKLIVMRDRDFEGKKQKAALAIVDRYLKRIRGR